MSIRSFLGLLLVGVVANLLHSPEAVVAAPTASELLNITESCSPLPNVSQFKTDASAAAATIPLCRSKGAIWFKADLDIDCDGGSTPECKADKYYLPETSCSTSEGKPLDASNLPFFVLPRNSNGFNAADYGVRCGSVGAVIYNGKVEYAILGDRGPDGVIGEASYAMAKRLGINPDPNSGGIASGVTYIVFTGSAAVLPKPIENHSSAVALGEKLATLEVPVANASGAITTKIVSIANDEWNFFGKQTQNNDLPVEKGRQEGDEGYWQRVVQYWKEGVGNSGVNSRSLVMSNKKPWSAVFISYVFKKAGAATAFPYSAIHSSYIKHAIKNRKNGNLNSSLVGYKVTEYSPEIGDLICAPREPDLAVTYDNALSYRNSDRDPQFASHCDVVVSVGNSSIDVIGGNVSDSVTKNTVKTNAGKVIAGPERKWFVVIQNNLD